jgi:hypothetical protein
MLFVTVNGGHGHCKEQGKPQTDTVIADLVGKGGHIRTFPVPDWVKDGIDAWMRATGITTGRLLRSINKAGNIWGTDLAPRSFGVL